MTKFNADLLPTMPLVGLKAALTGYGYDRIRPVWPDGRAVNEDSCWLVVDAGQDDKFLLLKGGIALLERPLLVVAYRSELLLDSADRYVDLRVRDHKRALESAQGGVPCDG